jgi:hypothetical protein
MTDQIDEYLDSLGADPAHQTINLIRKYMYIPSEKDRRKIFYSICINELIDEFDFAPMEFNACSCMMAVSHGVVSVNIVVRGCRRLRPAAVPLTLAWLKLNVQPSRLRRRETPTELARVSIEPASATAVRHCLGREGFVQAPCPIDEIPYERRITKFGALTFARSDRKIRSTPGGRCDREIAPGCREMARRSPRGAGDRPRSAADRATAGGDCAFLSSRSEFVQSWGARGQ